MCVKSFCGLVTRYNRKLCLPMRSQIDGSKTAYTLLTGNMSFGAVRLRICTAKTNCNFHESIARTQITINIWFYLSFNPFCLWILLSEKVLQFIAFNLVPKCVLDFVSLTMNWNFIYCYHIYRAFNKIDFNTMNQSARKLNIIQQQKNYLQFRQWIMAINLWSQNFYFTIWSKRVKVRPISWWAAKYVVPQN